jgi:hypothetical protein
MSVRGRSLWLNIKKFKVKSRVMYSNLSGGKAMMKMKLLTVVLFVLGAIGVALAVEVINVDLNGYNDYRPYVGNGAYDVGDDAVWIAYYQGWGQPVGSARSEGLPASNQGWYCAVYASQVWIGDKGTSHTYRSGSALMDDGFVANPGKEPNLAIWGQDAYRGIYDIYVYGSDAGSFTLHYYKTATTKTVTGGVAPGQFVNGGNYVVFSNVDINNSNSNDVNISYTNVINGLQLVRKKYPVSVGNGTKIVAGNYDVAGERNIQSSDPNGFGPDIRNGSVGWLETLEFMAYDITVTDANKGLYQICLDVNTQNSWPCNAVSLYLDDKYLGDVNHPGLNSKSTPTTTVNANLVAGSHTVKWELPLGASWGFNIDDVNFIRTGNVAINDCNGVKFYGLTLPADYTQNCIVGIDDLVLAMDNWLNCNNPDPNRCF